ncbi:MAG: ABC transporter permease [Oscillospiraceae bacterium]|nr:ABC transporter permease [Oscillospiraceae bacterium]
MLISENFRQAVNSLLLNKKRTVLTMIGIIIGLSSVLTIVSLGDTLGSVTKNFFIQYIGEGNMVNVVLDYDTETRKIDEGEKHTFTRDEIYDFIDSTDGMILDLQRNNGMNNLNGEVRIDSGHIAETNVSGVSSAYEITQKLEMVSGRFLTRNECRYAKPVAVISDRAAIACFGSCDAAVGESIDFQGQYTELYFNEETFIYEECDPVKTSSEFIVVGVYRYIEPVNILKAEKTDATPLYCPDSFYNSSLTDTSEPEDESRSWSFVVRDSESVPAVKRMIEDMIETKFGDITYSCLDTESELETITNIFSVITAAFVVIAAISLLVGGIGLMNTMLVSVTERTKEIGIKKALGARNSTIRTQFLFESALLCLIACGIGVFFGMLTGMLIETNLDKIAAMIPGEEIQYFILNNEIHVTPSLNAIIISTLFSLAVGIIFGLYPANKGAKMQPVDALRYE